MLHTLLKSVREYQLPSIISPILVIVEAAAETLIPFLMATIVDQGITPGHMSVIYQTGGWLLFIALFSLFGGAGASWISSYAAAGFAKNLRQDLFYHVEGFAFENIDRFSTAGLITRLTTDITNMQTAYQMAIRIAFRAPSMLLFSIIMAFTVNAEMASIFVIAIPILGLGLVAIIRWARPLFRQVFRGYDRLNQVVNENVHGIRVVKTYVRQQTEDTKFKTSSAAIFKNYSKAQRIMALNSPMMQLVSLFSMLALFWFGGKLIVMKGMETGQLISLFSYSMSIMFSLMMLSNIFTQLTIAQASAERLTAVFTTQPAIEDPTIPLTAVANGDIDFDQVNFSFDSAKGGEQLKDITLHIHSGQLVGLIGGTGSGKSSLVELIPRLYDATSGTVKVAGRDVKDYDLKTLRDNVAMVLQDSVLFSGTIADNLRWGDEHATETDLQHAARLAQADGFITSFPQKYNTEIEQNGNNVSGGQRQRLAIARALLKHPQILILDDATSAVDMNTEAAIRHALRTDIPHTTKLIISQRVASIADADMIIVMDQGRITGMGTHQELLQSNPQYKALSDAQTRQVGGR